MDTKSINKGNFMENYFKLITLTFWPIIWYKWIVISTRELELFLFFAFSLLSAVYVVLFIIGYFKKSKEERKGYMLEYRLSTILAFIVTLLSFVLYPKNIMLLYGKLFVISVYFYFSYVEVFKRKNVEGVVGIMSFLLLFIFTIFY